MCRVSAVRVRFVLWGFGVSGFGFRASGLEDCGWRFLGPKVLGLMGWWFEGLEV